MGWKQGEARWRFLVPFCKDSRRPIIERTMRSHVVVKIPPFGELCLRLLQRCEPLDVEAFIAESSVETLDEPVLHRPSRAEEAELHTRLYRPHLHGPAGELTLIIQGDAPRRASAFGARTPERGNYLWPVHRAICFQPDAFPRELIDDREEAD